MKNVTHINVYGWYRGQADLGTSAYTHNEPFEGTQEKGWEIAKELVNEENLDVMIKMHESTMLLFASTRGFGQR